MAALAAAVLPSFTACGGSNNDNDDEQKDVIEQTTYHVADYAVIISKNLFDNTEGKQVTFTYSTPSNASKTQAVKFEQLPADDGMVKAEGVDLYMAELTLFETKTGDYNIEASMQCVSNPTDCSEAQIYKVATYTNVATTTDPDTYKGNVGGTIKNLTGVSADKFSEFFDAMQATLPVLKGTFK